MRAALEISSVGFQSGSTEDSRGRTNGNMGLDIDGGKSNGNRVGQGGGIREHSCINSPGMGTLKRLYWRRGS